MVVSELKMHILWRHCSLCEQCMAFNDTKVQYMDNSFSHCGHLFQFIWKTVLFIVEHVAFVYNKIFDNYSLQQ